MFKELFVEGTKTISIDWASEEKGLDKKLSKEYKISIKDNGRMEATVKGDPKKIKAFLTSADYDMDKEDVEELFPELNEVTKSTDVSEEGYKEIQSAIWAVTRPRKNWKEWQEGEAEKIIKVIKKHYKKFNGTTEKDLRTFLNPAGYDFH